MDNTDKDILRILQKNSKATLKEMGEMVNLTSPAVMDRIRKMEDNGVIAGYFTKIDSSKLGMTMEAFISVDVNQKKYDAFCKFCNDSKNIISHHHIIGPYNAMLQVIIIDSNELSKLLNSLNFFGATQTSVILDTHFSNLVLK
ncbi:MAG TPA: Lrp/AsnC family transcriptional regulator [Anaerovoracaceae bacterium]|nr:Lrp/AsnC family transcriptional regulator [Anaerovoracaceae bacterium]